MLISKIELLIHVDDQDDESLDQTCDRLEALDLKARLRQLAEQIIKDSGIEVRVVVQED